MLYFIGSRARGAISRVVAATCFAFLAGAGSALAACPALPLSTPFQQWGDTTSYFLAPGGSLEGPLGDIGWNLSNASLSQGNEPFNVGAPGDAQSLTINGAGRATTPAFCVDSSMVAMRFFARQAAPGSDLRVEAVIPTWHGELVKQIGALADGSMPSWAPTDPIDGGAAQLPSGLTIMVALRFEVPSAGGSWQIDDIYVDPYRS